MKMKKDCNTCKELSSVWFFAEHNCDRCNNCGVFYSVEGYSYGGDGAHDTTSIVAEYFKNNKESILPIVVVGQTYPYFMWGHPINDWIFQTRKAEEAKDILISMEGYTSEKLEKLKL